MFKGDIVYDLTQKKTFGDFREGYVDFSLGKSVDVRAGRHIITWGVGDLLFINDNFPKDYEAFFSGKPMEYMKLGSDALKLDFFPRGFSAEFVYIPFFRANRFPSAPKFFVFDPFPAMTRETQEPLSGFENSQFALKLSKTIGDYDVSLYGYKGFYLFPSMQFASSSLIRLTYPRLAIYGFSAQGPGLGGIFSFEGGYYDSLNDRAGSNPTIENSSLKFLAGYQKPLTEDLNIGVQYYAESMSNYDSYLRNLPAGFPQQDQFNQWITLRLTQFLKHQTLRLSLFGFYSPNSNDSLLIPEMKYNVNDRLEFTMGFNIFGGNKDYTLFGQLEKNDNIYMNIRYNF
ncbi:MAG: hypothetical protein M1536_02550 [Firmicutes bacterium]|nr:hypothetical protein [Bacillota bacterium]